MNLVFPHAGIPRAAVAVVVALLALGTSQALADNFVDFTFASNATLTFSGNNIDSVSGSFEVDTTTNTVQPGASFTLTGPVYANTYSIGPSGPPNSITGTNGGTSVVISFLSPFLTDASVPTGGSNISIGQYFVGETLTDTATGFSGVNAVAAPGPIPGAGLLSYLALGLLGLGSMGWKRLRQQTLTA